MRISAIKIQNFRTLENCTIEFESFYTALSGKNNSGKSNVINAIRLFLHEEDYYPFVESNDVSYKVDYPKWKPKDVREPILFEVGLTVDREQDAGLFRFISTFVSSLAGVDTLSVVLKKELTEKSDGFSYGLSVNGADVTDAYIVREIHKRFRSSNAFIYHNSVHPLQKYTFGRNFSSFFGDFSDVDKTKLKDAKERVFQVLKNVIKKHKEEIVELLGRLDDKYDVSISIPTLDIESFPFALSLGVKNYDVPLDEWGSGTQNRTLILLALLKARKIKDVAPEADKITPIIIIEEPESFLHPSAQAEFGKVLQDLSSEFQVQVITTTHSPYMLSVDKPECNILLSRRAHRKHYYETNIIKATDESWMEPFAIALGINNSSFLEWKDVIFKHSDSILLVEGDIDKEYFEMLCEDSHCDNKLKFKGEIFPYGGEGFFSNGILLKFILNRIKKVFITYDLDVDGRVAPILENLGLKRNVDFLAVGLNQNGKRDIEGLLPSSVISAVYAAHPELVDVAVSKERENNSARQTLKRKKLEEFKRQAEPLSDHYKEFYKIASCINKAIAAT